MSAFGNLFSVESKTDYAYTSYQDSFKNVDSNNTTINKSPTLKDVFTTSISINQPSDWAKVAPYIAMGIAAAIVLIALLRGR